MCYVGIDLGTTSVSLVATDESGKTISTRTRTEDRSLYSPESWARLQDPERTIYLASAALEEIRTSCGPIAGIGVTGQMHGILYVDQEGLAVSPLYTWQDGRGGVHEADGMSACEVLSAETGTRFAPGYGLATHRYNLRHGLVPASAASMTTIGGYLAMRLTGLKEPLLHASDAASLGGWQLPEGRFTLQDPLLPEVTGDSLWMGKMQDGTPVSVSLGDNQASFLGSVSSPENSLLINIGTGSQVTALSSSWDAQGPIEARPYLDGCFLLAGCSLCGGRAYALLERFFRESASMAGPGPSGDMYEAMNRLALKRVPDPPVVIPTFCGTREEPERTGAILNLTEENFTPAHLIQGVLNGMAEELYSFYDVMKEKLPHPPIHLIGSGNGLTRNIALQRILEDRFALPLTISSSPEDAARGAAIFAARIHHAERNRSA